jgi:hypothetical protein
MTPLHNFGESLRNILLQIPLPAVRVLFVATLIILLVWVMRLPASRTTPESGAKRWDENLKIGAGLALTLQIVIYIWL